MSALAETVEETTRYGVKSTWAGPTIVLLPLEKGQEIYPGKTMLGKVKTYESLGKVASFVTYASVTLDLTNTWTENNSNTNAERLEKSGVIITGIVTSDVGGKLVGTKAAIWGSEAGLLIGGPEFDFIRIEHKS